MVTALKLRIEIPTLVDELGQVKAQIADLEEREKGLRDQLVEAGGEEYEGELFRATVARYEQRKTDWKAVAEACQPSRQLVTAHTEVGERVTVKVVSR